MKPVAARSPALVFFGRAVRGDGQGADPAGHQVVPPDAVLEARGYGQGADSAAGAYTVGTPSRR